MSLASRARFNRRLNPQLALWATVIAARDAGFLNPNQTIQPLSDGTLLFLSIRPASPSLQRLAHLDSVSGPLRRASTISHARHDIKRVGKTHERPAALRRRKVLFDTFCL